MQEILPREKKNLSALLKECEDVGHASEIADDPIAQIARSHRILTHLCATLEDIADSLPQHFDPEIIAPVLPVLRKDLPWHFENIESALYPLLQRRGAHYGEMPGLIERLRMDHAADTVLAQDVADGLELLSESGSHPNTEALGFMLRCFFVALRRHSFWEEHMVLAWARKLLLPADLETMRAILALNRRSKLNRGS